MKFMLIWNIHQEKRHQVVESFAQRSLEEYKAEQGASIKIIGRWHDAVRLRGVVICETDDTEALNLWLMKWSSVMDLDIAPVVDDDEAHATAKKFLSGD